MTGSPAYSVIGGGRGPTIGNGDAIAVLANQDGFGNWLTSADPTPSRDYPMDAAHAGIVNSGDLAIS